jgi:uncharacterized protein (TIGR04255 family)
MTEYTIFPNAPIVEAILDIRVKLPGDITLTDLLPFHDSIKQRFATKKERKFLKGGFALLPEPRATVDDSGTDGYFFESSSEKKVVQARLDGFTFNKLKPYERWNLFRDEARELWNVYFEATHPTEILRIALRYINRIEVPLPLGDFSEYILTNPQVAPGLPQGVGQFFMHLVLRNNDIGADANIVETMDKATSENKLPLILDIDVWRKVQYTDNNEAMWDEFERLRNFKNDIFFKSTTEKAKELFK